MEPVVPPQYELCTLRLTVTALVAQRSMAASMGSTVDGLLLTVDHDLSGAWIVCSSSAVRQPRESFVSPGVLRSQLLIANCCLQQQ